jgi:hypothetical protein
MLTEYFYNARVRRAVATFGALFDNINVLRKNSAGAVISQVKVPLSYAPKRDFLARIDAMQNGEDAERMIAVKLPRMSFEIVGMTYDGTRQLPKLNNCKVIADNASSQTEALKLYSPVPYNINFQLSIYAKGQDDALQIVEQILPYFTPEYSVTIKPLDGYSEFVEDSPLILDNISFTDDFEAPLEARRTIIYTLDFTMRISLYRTPSSNSKVITSFDVDLINEDNEVIEDVVVNANQIDNDSASTTENTAVTVSNFQITLPQDDFETFTVGVDPTNGTATASFTEMTTNQFGFVVAKGTYTYTPNASYTGADTFTIYANYANSAGRLEVPISITVS